MNVCNLFPYHSNQTLCASRNQIYMMYGCSNDADMHEYMHYVSKLQQSHFLWTKKQRYMNAM